MSFKSCLVIALIMGATGCREANQPIAPGENARIEVKSDPQGADIYLDGTATGKVTPDLLRNLSGSLHEVLVRLERDGVVYGYRTNVDVRGDSLIVIDGPLMMPRCGIDALGAVADCGQKYRTVGTLRMGTNPNGALFNYVGSGGGLLYPSNTQNPYAAAGLPLIAMLAGTRDTLALSIYDFAYLAGRPAPQVSSLPDAFSLRQSFWVVPPAAVIAVNAPTVRGIEVEEEVIGNATSDVVFLKLTFRNITNSIPYQAVDPFVPSAGIRYDSVYVGFGLDPDIGDSDDDMIAYEPGLDLVYAYDHNFQEPTFSPAVADRPALVGLKILSAPAAATLRVLNAWPSSHDWAAGQNSEITGWGVLSGARTPLLPDAPGRQVGHLPQVKNDYRMSVSAGPLTLAPGASVSITVAIVMTAPVPGSFTSGQAVDPGTANMQSIAAALFDKVRSLVAP